MKKLGIAIIAFATLTIGYLYFCGCCPETCCETATACQKTANTEASAYQLPVE